MSQDEMNLGGYDDSAFNESDGNALLTLLLQSKRTIKTHFTEMDKGPNFDGSFDLLIPTEKKKLPVKKLEVQIKTINKDYADKKGQYKYSCDTKIFNAVKKGITSNPAILFLIDINNKKCFYIYASEQFVFDLNLTNEGEKTIYFNDSNLITDIDTFYKTMEDIYDKKHEIMLDPQKSILQIDPSLNKEIKKELQDTCDYLNQMFDIDLKFIKNEFFQDTWKFGLAFKLGDSQKFSHLGIYKLKHGENGLLIKSFDIKDFDFISGKSDGLLITGFGYTGLDSLKERINNFISSVLKRYFIDNYIHPKYLPDVVLEEIAFYFLDSIAKNIKRFEKIGFPCVYYKDEETLDNVKQLFFALTQLAIEQINSLKDILSNKQDKQNEKKLSDIILIDPLKTLKELGKKANNIFDDIYNNKVVKNETDYEIVIQGKFYKQLENVIQELENRKINVIRRVWRHKDLMNVHSEGKIGDKCYRGETGYKIDDFYDNLDKLYYLIPTCYQYSMEKLFNKLVNYYSITDEYHIFYSKGVPPLIYKLVTLKNNMFSIHVHNNDTFISVDDDFKELEENFPGGRYIIGGIVLNLQAETPLYTYIKLLIYKSICDKHGLQIHKEHGYRYPLI